MGRAQQQDILIDHMNDAVLAWDWNGPITFWNRGAERLYGFPRAEALARISYDLLGTRAVGGVVGFMSSLERNGAWEGELEQRARDGQTVVVESRMVRIREHGHSFVLETDRDITRRKRAEAASCEARNRLETRIRELSAELEQSNASLGEIKEYLRLIVAGVRDYAIFTLDSGGNIATWNQGAECIKGYRAEEILGQHFSRFYPQEDIDHGDPARELAVALAEGHYLGEGWRVRKDGSQFWANVLITPIFDGKRRLRGFSKVTRDMTQSRLDEAALKESQARIEGIINSAMDAIISVDAQQCIVLFNAAAEKMFGCPAAAVIGQSIGMFLPSRLRERHRQHVQVFGATGVTSRSMRSLGVLSGMRANGEEFPMEASISRLEVAGQRLYTVILRDITERERAAEAIRQLNSGLEQRVLERTAQLEAANRELEAFSYSVSHDLRAPLRAVDGFSQALIEDYGSSLPEGGQHYLKNIREGAQRMGALIDDLLTFARLSRQPLSKRSMDTAKLVRDTLEELNVDGDGRCVEVRVGELPPCQGDRALLKQVWTNLLSNALKYTRRRDSALIEIGNLSKDGEIVYFVRDNGTGFDMKYAGKLFGVFQRLHRAEDFEGTGVGLAIVQRVIHRHGGRIWADAAVDQGATFYFTLEENPKE